MTIQPKNAFQSFGLYPAADLVSARGAYPSYFKRALDIALVLLSLPVVLPLTLGMALLILVLERQSPVYWSERVGRGGRVFRMMKLRTMVNDADARLAAHLAATPEAAAEWAATQKLKCDPRITRVGFLMRKTSLDELPQLWNVLKGDMALVGPRPMMPDQQPLSPGRASYELRPGVTGPWQVSARNLSTFAARADYDGEYARNLSFGNDLRLLLRTVMVVLRGTGY